MTLSFRGVSARNFTEFLRDFLQSFSTKVCGEKNGLREHMWFLTEFSPWKFAFENFCLQSDAKKELFSWADLYVNISNIFSSETTGPLEAKFHVEPPWDRGMKIYSNGPGHMTKDGCHAYIW